MSRLPGSPFGAWKAKTNYFHLWPKTRQKHSIGHKSSARALMAYIEEVADLQCHKKAPQASAHQAFNIRTAARIFRDRCLKHYPFRLCLKASYKQGLHSIHDGLFLSHPHPLERPESAWLCTSAETTSPRELMKARRSSLVVPHDRFPTKTVLLTGATAGTAADVVIVVWR